jgi:hypothetical protein
MYVRPLSLLVACALGLAACGGEEEEAPTRSSEAANRQAALDFAKCMREQGIDFPDPQPGRGLLRVGGDATPEEMREAEQACEKYRAALEPPELSEAQQQEFKKAALEHARCMREHGVDFPDPTFSEDGAARVEMRRGSGGPDPDDEDFKAAQEACGDKLGRIMEEQP